jgi:hypothetical protein
LPEHGLIDLAVKIRLRDASELVSLRDVDGSLAVLVAGHAKFRLPRPELVRIAYWLGMMVGVASMDPFLNRNLPISMA